MKKILMLLAMTFVLSLGFADDIDLDDIDLTFTDENNGISLSIPAGNGEFKQIFDPDGDSSFTLVDANNDGYLDIKGYCPLGSGSMGSCYHLYIYNPKEKKFENPEEFYNLEIHGDGTITSSSSSNSMGSAVTSTKYKWDGRKFKKI
ncbi:XAC2610-related protein [Treponema zioleckii]|uniref:XAC2610-related protein n=1 Tax=Treponema zioleckii TaxID=331680 RepID=UPI00168BE04A|nr:hypothetical protein [Treponema zioleckii]